VRVSRTFDEIKRIIWLCTAIVINSHKSRVMSGMPKVGVYIARSNVIARASINIARYQRVIMTYN
jgi:hypothetical protein